MLTKMFSELIGIYYSSAKQILISPKFREDVDILHNMEILIFNLISVIVLHLLNLHVTLRL